MKAPLVSVVTVTYNSSKFVRDAIESVLASSYTNLELIVGDDASADDTWAIVQSYSDSRIVAYRNEKNLGEYANRNKAVNLAKGEYLIFIDGDDMIYPHGLDFMVKMLQAFPECGMALMWWNQADIFFPVVITSEQFYIGEYFGRGVLGSAFSNVFFRTEILRRVGGLSSQYRAGDDYIRYKIAAQHSVLLIGDGLTWWRETPGQASQQFQNSDRYLIEAYSLKFEFLRSHDCPLQKGDKMLAEKNLYTALSKQVIKMLLVGEFKAAINLVRYFDIPFQYLTKPKAKLVRKNPFQGFSSVYPCRLPKERNPFSTTLKTFVR